MSASRTLNAPHTRGVLLSPMLRVITKRRAQLFCARYTLGALCLFDRIDSKKPTHAPQRRPYRDWSARLFDELYDSTAGQFFSLHGIVCAALLVCDRETRMPIHEIDLGDDCGGLVRGFEAARSAALTARDPRLVTSRREREAEPCRQGAAALIGHQVVLACCFVPDETSDPLTREQLMQVEDMGELFLFALGRTLRRKCGIFIFDDDVIRRLADRYEQDLFGTYRHRLL